MSTFTKRYFDPKDEHKHLTLVWEQGYRNIHIYYFKKLIQVIEDPVELKRGTWFDSEDVGKVSLAFTQDRPMKIELKVNGKKYRTVNKLKRELPNFVLLRALFIMFATTRAIGIMSVVNSINLWTFWEILVYNGIFFTGYLLSAILIKSYPKVFYVGTSLYAFMVLLHILSWVNVYPLGIRLDYDVFTSIFFFIIQAMVLSYFIRELKAIRKYIAPKKPQQEDVLIDDI
ncbi:hypothetical protein SAMN05216474_0361 [Lishizhenia tianjinensis]|uniref:Uncharacterized protein n=1 Tax=Lishizhenia tianjinensis TaxID=477690 RepID=A0A1I6XPA8_9FLAO|nr:hypothetical protein [Lishizhenia tianjinensis]SFT40235.1 hypothetical protein SAMN05216474_0361 [Lishizhenia tianjinensis]